MTFWLPNLKESMYIGYINIIGDRISNKIKTKKRRVMVNVYTRRHFAFTSFAFNLSYTILKRQNC